jgi:hypothetical protein
VHLSIASTRVLLNGNSRERIYHARRFCQGDPISSMMYLIVMEVLNALIQKVDAWSLFHPQGVRSIPDRTSLYANDLVMFISLVL